MSTARTHIIKRKDGWAVKKQGSSRASKVYRNQGDAIQGARKMNSTSEIVVHKRDGSIRKWIKKK
ncbi:MAG TPA: DUF2188 domain-containing protein [Gracilimonas sp.]|uniref:DUF2188 domain-containing protein n=1 Tax=Gracilimonas sp. TaxID=1974203 RepID=UPI002DA4244E|nr:DUF2188 domain-containing protein [Gracilimonas sp.]